jgi:hypothetical protein
MIPYSGYFSDKFPFRHMTIKTLAKIDGCLCELLCLILASPSQRKNYKHVTHFITPNIENISLMGEVCKKNNPDTFTALILPEEKSFRRMSCRFPDVVGAVGKGLELEDRSW